MQRAVSGSRLEGPAGSGVGCYRVVLIESLGKVSIAHVHVGNVRNWHPAAGSMVLHTYSHHGVLRETVRACGAKSVVTRWQQA